jgi:hypothetical protein
MEDEIYVDIGAPNLQSNKNEMMKLIMRLPSLILADYILSNNDIILDEINQIFSSSDRNILSFICIQVFARFILLIMVSICITLMIIRINFVKIIYKFIVLILMPFIFTTTMKFLQEQEYIDIKMPIVCLIYSIISSITIYLYSEIYKNILHNYTTIDEQNNLDSALKTRRFYIFFYSFCSLVVNETGIFVSLKSDKENINLMSLGYLTLLFFDLSVNLNQIVLSLAENIKNILQIVHNFGVINILQFNWYQRIKVPCLLRCFFLLKFSFFTIKFICHMEYYFGLNEILENENLIENFPLFYYINYLFDMSFEPYTNFGKEQYEFINIFNENQTKIIVYLKFLILNLTETSMSTAAMISIISLQFSLFGQFIKKIILFDFNQVVNRMQEQNIDNLNENDLLNISDVSAILLTLLSIQSGLTGLHGKNR